MNIAVTDLLVHIYCFSSEQTEGSMHWPKYDGDQQGSDGRTGAVVALRKETKEEPPCDPRDAPRLIPKSSPHGADDFSHHGLCKTPTLSLDLKISFYESIVVIPETIHQCHLVTR